MTAPEPVDFGWTVRVSFDEHSAQTHGSPASVRLTPLKERELRGPDDVELELQVAKLIVVCLGELGDTMSRFVLFESSRLLRHAQAFVNAGVWYVNRPDLLADVRSALLRAGGRAE